MAFLSISEHLLPTTGTSNTRDLGGYPTLDNYITRQNVFFRSDSSANFTPADIELLMERGLGLVIDLRSLSESDEHPSKLNKLTNLKYQQLPMIGDLSALSQQTFKITCMSVLYTYLLDHAGESIAKIFKLFAKAISMGQASLFHCAVGKDRTGVIAMLLLKLANVSDEFIIEDYAITETLMAEVFAMQRKHFTKHNIVASDVLFTSRPESMKSTLIYLRNNYVTAYDYLLSIGVSEKSLQIIIDGFVKKS